MAQSAGPCWSWLAVALYTILQLLPTRLCAAQPAPIQELITVNVSTLRETQEVNEQVSYNLSYDGGQMHLNGYLLSKGVSRISGKMNTSKQVSDWKPYEQPNLLREALVGMRILVLHWPMNRSTGEAQIIVQQEVISVDGYQAKQDVTMDVKLVVDNNSGVLQYTISPVVLNDTWLHKIPWDKDNLFTFPNSQQSGDSVPQDTTREYNVRQNTTLDEKPFEGELPETPLRAVIPSSSYKVMCQFADDLREKLCLFWKKLYPVLVRFMEVFIVGVISSALILEFLKLVYPPQYKNAILHPSDCNDSALLVSLMLSHDALTTKAQEAGSIL